MSLFKKLTVVYYDLNVTLEAGLSITRAINTISGGQKRRMKKVFTRVGKSVSEGNNLADSMAEHAKLFPEMDLKLIQAAEEAGELPRCFKLLSDWYDFRIKIGRIIKTGMILPFLVVFIAAVAIPFPQMFLGNISMVEYLIKVLSILSLLLVPVGFVVLLMFLSTRIKFIRLILDHIVLRIPLLGSAVWQMSICRYFRGFNMLHKSGVPIIEALKTAQDLSGNMVVSGLVKGASKSAAAGNTALEGFSHRLPSEYLNMWEVGEQSGELDKMVDKIAEISGDKAELYFIQFAKWLPWVIYILISIGLIIMVFQGWKQIYSQMDVRF